MIAVCYDTETWYSSIFSTTERKNYTINDSRYILPDNRKYFPVAVIQNLDIIRFSVQQREKIRILHITKQP